MVHAPGVCLGVEEHAFEPAHGGDALAEPLRDLASCHFGNVARACTCSRRDYCRTLACCGTLLALLGTMLAMPSTLKRDTAGAAAHRLGATALNLGVALSAEERGGAADAFASR